ncbi:MAG: glycosyltransferase [bacterium]|nr:glycosyltransferase [bacterium]
MTFLSIIVPLYNDTESVTKLLTSLENQNRPRESYEIIVVDNGSNEKIDHLADRFNIRLLSETDIQSSYAARNKGIQAARGDILCFTDSDCVADEDWLSEGVKALEENQADLVGGNVVFYVSSKKSAAELYDASCNMQMESNVRERGVAITANLFMRKQVVDTMGPFGCNMISGGDILFTANAVQNGFKLIYCRNSRVTHPARRFKELMKKAIRVGTGKFDMAARAKNSNQYERPKQNVLRKKRKREHLNPMTTRNELKNSGFHTGLFRLPAVLAVSYCYLFTMFLAYWKRKLTARQTAMPDQSNNVRPQKKTIGSKAATGRFQALKPLRKPLSVLLTLLLMGYIVFYILQHLEDFSAITSIRLTDMGLLMAMVLMSTLVAAVRLLVVMRKFGLPDISFGDWFRIFVLARFFNRLLPQGGNIYRAMKLKREKGYSLKNYTLSFMSFTWIELVVTFMLISGVIAVFEPDLKVGVFFALPFCLLAMALLVVVPAIYRVLVRKVRGGGFLSTSMKQIGLMLEKTIDIKLLAKNVFLCLLSFSLAVVYFYIAFHSLGVSIGIGALAVFTAIMKMGLLISVTPGNIGVLELAYGTLATSFGADFSTGLMVAAVTRTISFIALMMQGALLGGFPLLKEIKMQKQREQEQCMA